MGSREVTRRLRWRPDATGSFVGVATVVSPSSSMVKPFVRISVSARPVNKLYAVRQFPELGEIARADQGIVLYQTVGDVFPGERVFARLDVLLRMASLLLRQPRDPRGPLSLAAPV